MPAAVAFLTPPASPASTSSTSPSPPLTLPRSPDSPAYASGPAAGWNPMIALAMRGQPYVPQGRPPKSGDGRGAQQGGGHGAHQGPADGCTTSRPILPEGTPMPLLLRPAAIRSVVTGRLARRQLRSRSGRCVASRRRSAAALAQVSGRRVAG